MEQRIREQAQHLEAARTRFEEASAETRPLKLEDWTHELSLLDEEVVVVRVGVELQLSTALPSIINSIMVKVYFSAKRKAKKEGRYLFQPESG